MDILEHVSGDGLATAQDITEKEYFASDRVSNSDLSLLKSSPLYFRKVKDNQEEGPFSTGFRFGSLFDCKVLTPNEFNDRYVLLPPGASLPSTSSSSYQDTFCNLIIEGMTPLDAFAQAGYSLKGNPEEKAEELARSFSTYISIMTDARTKNKEVYTVEDLQKCTDMIQSLVDHKACKRLLFETPADGAAVNQLIIFFEWLGVDCRCMIDRVRIDTRERIVELIDLKTTSKPLSSFAYSYQRYGYDRQQAFYREAFRQWSVGTPWEDFYIKPIIVVADTERAHECRALDTSRYIVQGHQEAKRLLREMKWHQDNGLWEYSREYYEGDGIEELVYEGEDGSSDSPNTEEI